MLIKINLFTLFSDEPLGSWISTGLPVSVSRYATALSRSGAASSPSLFSQAGSKLEDERMQNSSGTCSFRRAVLGVPRRSNAAGCFPLLFELLGGVMTGESGCDTSLVIPLSPAGVRVVSTRDWDSSDCGRRVLRKSSPVGSITCRVEARLVSDLTYLPSRDGPCSSRAGNVALKVQDRAGSTGSSSRVGPGRWRREMMGSGISDRLRLDT